MTRRYQCGSNGQASPGDEEGPEAKGGPAGQAAGVRVVCPGCGRGVRVRSTDVGGLVRCPYRDCRAVIPVGESGFSAEPARKTPGRGWWLWAALGALLLAGPGQPARAGDVEEAVYRHRPDPGAPTAASNDVSVCDNPDGTTTVTGLTNHSVVAAQLTADGLGPGAMPIQKVTVDNPGSVRIKVVIHPRVGRTRLAGLSFRNGTTVDVLRDGSVRVDREGVRAEDGDGTRYVSRWMDRSRFGRQIVMVKADTDGAGPARPAPDTGELTVAEKIERMAAARVKSARWLLEDGCPDKARASLRRLLEDYPKTKAAAEGRALLEQLDKK